MLDFSWRVLVDLCGSDHFPIVVKHQGPATGGREPGWRLKKADWHSFRTLCEERLTAEIHNSPEAIASFTDTLISIADETVPKSSATPKHVANPWLDADCEKSIKDRKKAERKFNWQPTAENLTTFKIKRAMACRVIKEKRRQCWRQFVSSINNRTPLSKVWRLIRRLKGKGGGGNVQHLKLSDTVLTTTDEIAQTLAQTFAHNSSADNCLPRFIPIKHRHEKQKLKFCSEIYNNEEYNQLFTMEELRRSLNRSRDTVVGPDKIHYHFLKHLSESSLRVLLRAFNKIWQTGQIPLCCTDFYDFFRVFDFHEFLFSIAWLFEALTSSHREDGLSCQHGVNPPLTHSLTHSLKNQRMSLSSHSTAVTRQNWECLWEHFWRSAARREGIQVTYKRRHTCVPRPSWCSFSPLGKSYILVL